MHLSLIIVTKNYRKPGKKESWVDFQEIVFGLCLPFEVLGPAREAQQLQLAIVHRHVTITAIFNLWMCRRKLGACGLSWPAERQLESRVSVHLEKSKPIWLRCKMQGIVVSWLDSADVLLSRTNLPQLNMMLTKAKSSGERDFLSIPLWVIPPTCRFSLLVGKFQ